VRLIVAGKPGWGAQEVVGDLERRANVRLEISPTDSRLAELYRDAALLVFPSQAEGFGLPVAEAMASGLPVVTSDLPAVREFAGEAPWYCRAGMAADFATAIEALLSDPEERARRSALGRLAARSLTWDAVGEAMAVCIEEAVDGR
jgi:glycosyltransferase involved in cell wall biosynthesis